MFARFGIPLLVVTNGCCGIAILEEDPSSGGSGGSSEGGASDGGTSDSSGGSVGTGGEGGCASQWTRIVGGASSNWLRSQAVGPDGSVAVTVDNIGEITLDGVSLGLPEGGFVLLKLDRHGELQWARHFAGSTQLPRLPVAFDSIGNVIVGGIGYDEIDLGGGVSANPGGATGFVAKWSADGVPMWIQAWSVPIQSGGIGDMVVDDGDNIYFNGGIGYDEEDKMQWGSLSTTGHVFIGKILADGTPAWVRGYRGMNVESRGLATTPTGHVVMGASLLGEGSFDGFSLSTESDYDVLVLDIDPDGAVVDARQFGDDALQRSYGMAIGADGSRAIVGSTWGVIDFGGGPVIAPDNHGAFFAGFDARGKNTFTKVAPEAYSPRALSGLATGGFAFAGGADLSSAWGCTGDAEGMVVSTFDASGACTSQETLAKCGIDPNCAIFLAGVSVTSSRVVASGYFYGDLHLGDEVHDSAIWDGFISSRTVCDAP